MLPLQGEAGTVAGGGHESTTYRSAVTYRGSQVLARADFVRAPRLCGSPQHADIATEQLRAHAG